MELAIADVDRDHARRAGLQEAVGEPSRRGAHVRRVTPLDVHVERVERIPELLAATGHEGRGLLDVELDTLVDLLPRLVVAGDEAGENERLRLASARGEPPLEEQRVQALLHARVVRSKR